jgi:hypothetical protein
MLVADKYRVWNVGGMMLTVGNLNYSETSIIISEGNKGKKCKMLEITPAEKF